jgi:hypothetical protein
LELSPEDIIPEEAEEVRDGKLPLLEKAEKYSNTSCEAINTVSASGT